MVDKLSGQVELIEVSSRRGRAATIAIGTITTGAAGTNASVTNVGTSGEAVFNFTIPMGDAVELRIDGGYLQWKNTTAATWTNILEIADITATIDIGTVTTGDPGTDVAVTNSGVGKDAVFNFAIPRGDSVELRIDSGYIQWKGTIDEVWNNLHAVSAITPTITVGTVTTGNAGTDVAVTNSGTGKDGIFNFTIPRGDDVQLRISEGYFQWKNTTASTWNNIYAISDITATIEVGTVTTGDADSSVTFTNVGSGKDAIFNLSIPKGTTFTPSVSAEGVISFTNDGGIANPTSVNIKGVQGDAAPNTIWQYSADNITWTTSVPDGVRYMRESTDNGTTWSTAIELPSVAALALKAPLASPTFTGDVIVPDQSAGNNSTKAANTKYVDAKVSDAIVNGVTGIAPSQNVVYDELLIKEQVANLTYAGVDLTTKFATEIASYADVWAWIKARITNVNYAGLNIGDYIPFTMGAETIWAQIAGIDTYYRTGDTAIGHHIDFISKDLMATAYKWNTTGTNNGSAVDANPYMVSTIKATLDGLVASLPAGLQAQIIEKRVFVELRYSASGTLTSSTGEDYRNIGKLWLPSEFEVYGTIKYSTATWSAGQCIQYPVFKKTTLKNISAISSLRDTWWLCTPHSGSSVTACVVSTYGMSYYQDVITSRRVPLCFRIG